MTEREMVRPDGLRDEVVRQGPHSLRLWAFFPHLVLAPFSGPVVG